MKSKDLKLALSRSPFRPFLVQLDNGETYSFNQPKDLGVTKDWRVFFHFSDNGEWCMFDAANISSITAI
jgi:hypothetical protein